MLPVTSAPLTWPSHGRTVSTSSSSSRRVNSAVAERAASSALPDQALRRLATTVVVSALVAGRCRSGRPQRRSTPRVVRRASAEEWRAKVTAACTDYLKFVNKTGSPAHTVAAAKELLAEAGFVELSEAGPWTLEPGRAYYVTMQGTSIGAFAVGKNFDSSKGGVVITAAHTDSPCLKLRPCSKISAQGTDLLQLGVSTYGGGLWHTWFDRPLGVAGTIVVSDGSGGLKQQLVHVAEPLCVIPNLAIHLTSDEERKGFAPNPETQMRPVLCLTPLGDEKDKAKDSEAEGEDSKSEEAEKIGFGPQHHAELLEAVAKAANVEAEHVLDVDLCLMDAMPACTMGRFVSSPRIDNVLSTWASISALADCVKGGELETSSDLLVAASFDHEEVGSQSASGADSAIMGRWLDLALEGLSTSWSKVASRSFLLSCDCAHGLHPNYTHKHQDQHKPLLGKGVVIKTNANQRYATTPLLAQMVREVASRSVTPMQEFVVRNDSRCGSTIGPLLSSQLGVRTVDVGAPQWAMHSARETGHGDDVAALQSMCRGIYKHFRDVDANTVHL